MYQQVPVEDASDVTGQPRQRPLSGQTFISFCGLFVGLFVGATVAGSVVAILQPTTSTLASSSSVPIKSDSASSSQTPSSTNRASETSSARLPSPTSTISSPLTQASFSISSISSEPRQSPIPVWFDDQLWWDGTYDTYPRPLPVGASTPQKDAIGKYAYVTMITGHGHDFEQYTCLGLAWLASLKATAPSPNIDIVIALLIDDGDGRYRRTPKPKSGEQQNTTAEAVLGEYVYGTYLKAGVTKFVIWRELPTAGRHMAGSWKQAWSKLQVWNLVEYEKVLFMDSDTLVLRNLDHLFGYPEFSAASTWDCANARSPLKPSGGFWLLQPSSYTFGLILAYMNGRDPCGHSWRMGDMTMTRILFMDLRVLADPDKSQWQRFDGDFERWGRCREAHVFPSRIDIIDPSWTFNRKIGLLSPLDRWNQLNESYDVLVGPCDDPAFSLGVRSKYDDRYRWHNGKGKQTWDRNDAFSVHFSCGPKPDCRVAYHDLAPCQRAMFQKWYDFLHMYYNPEK